MCNRAHAHVDTAKAEGFGPHTDGLRSTYFSLLIFSGSNQIKYNHVDLKKKTASKPRTTDSENANFNVNSAFALRSPVTGSKNKMGCLLTRTLRSYQNGTHANAVQKNVHALCSTEVHLAIRPELAGLVAQWLDTYFACRRSQTEFLAFSGKKLSLKQQMIGKDFWLKFRRADQIGSRRLSGQLHAFR